MTMVSRFYAICFAAVALASSSFGALEFKQKPTQLPTLAVGEALDFALVNTLSKSGTGALRWSVGSTALPGWMTLDHANGRLVGTPRFENAGEARFTMNVSDSTDDGIINQEFVVRVSAPPLWKSEALDFGIQNENVPWLYDLKSALRNPAGGDVKFAAENLQEWMTLNTDTGVISGTPQTIHVGPYAQVKLSATSRGETSTILAHGLVMRFNKPPQWKQEEVTLADANEGSPFSQDLSAYLVNPQKIPVTFELIDATEPLWLRIGKTSALLFGTPTRDNHGDQTAEVVLHGTLDGVAFEDHLKIRFKVGTANRAPEWVTKDLRLPPALTDIAYRQELSGSASDPDKEPIQFRILSGPEWLTLDLNKGTLGGTPPKTAVGTNRWTLSVTDPAGLSDTTTLQLEVTKSNEPPKWLNPLSFPPAQQGKPYALDLSGYATDPDGDLIRFTKLSGPNWLQVTLNGTLSGVPGRTDVGVSRFRLRASDGVSPAAVVEVMLFVEPVNQAPKWALDPVYFTKQEGQAFTIDLTAYARDEDPGDTLSFGILEGPAWAELSTQGILTGIPVKSAQNEVPIRVRVRDKEGLRADAKVILNVQPVNHAPHFTADPVQLKQAQEGVIYNETLAPFAEDEDEGDTLTFEKATTNPAWLTVAPNGALSGTPTANDVGLNRFEVRVVDKNNETAQVEAQILVAKENRAPRWRQETLLLLPAPHSMPYVFELSTLAIDEDGDRLKFEKVSGPEWLTVAENGKLGGTPPADAVGDFDAEFKVSDASAEARAKAKGKVTKQNRAPVVQEIPAFVVRERNELRFELDVPQYVSDPDGDKLRFRLAQNSDWVTLDESGKLTVSPRSKNLGEHVFPFTVDDGQLSTKGTVKVQILRDPRTPVWLEDPMDKVVRAGEAFTFKISEKARELDNQPLRFSKKSGPNWLEIAADGTLSGVAPAGTEGVHTFILSACNETLCADGTLFVTLAAQVQTETIALDDNAQATPIDVLWVIDHSKSSDKTVRELKREANGLFDNLAKRSVAHQNLILSSEADRWKGAPVAEASDPVTVSAGNASLLATFNRRADLALSADECPNCYSSPTFAMRQFFDSMNTYEDRMPNGFLREGVPADVVILTHQRDHYPKYVSGEEPSTPDEIWQNLSQKAADRKTSLRVHTLTPACPDLLELSGDLTSAGPQETFRLLVSKSFGRILAPSCEFDMRQAMGQLATALTARSRAHAHTTFKLKAKPSSVGEVHVELEGRALRGPSGSQEPQWQYDAAKNEVRMLWDRIDFGQLNGSETIRIQYPVQK